MPPMLLRAVRGDIAWYNPRLMKLFCPNCGTPLRPEDADLFKQTVRCRSCGNDFDFGQRRGPQQPQQSEQPPLRDRPLVPQPSRMRVERSGGHCTIYWRWFTPTYLGLLIFCIAWDSFLVFWYSMALGGHGAPCIMIIFPIGHVAVGVGLTYTTLAGFLNHTRIELSASELSIAHAPLPWWGSRIIPAAEIAQLYCERGKMTRNHQPSYLVSIALRNGMKQKLVSVNGVDEAKFLEQTIEEFYHIVNKPVAGELRKGQVDEYYELEDD